MALTTTLIGTDAVVVACKSTAAVIIELNVTYGRMCKCRLLTFVHKISSLCIIVVMLP